VALATTPAQHIELADEIADYSCGVAGNPGFIVTFVTPAVTPVERDSLSAIKTVA
jgi:hypothetical protein